MNNQITTQETNTSNVENETRPIHCTKKPAYNVLSQKEFQNRAAVIFSILDDILGKSFGAYGAPTIISNYPYTHITKDGFTIARNINFDFVSGEPVDRVIASMAIDICARLNYAVGDGTTTAIIATNQIYKSAMKIFDDIGCGLRAKDIIEVFTKVKDKLVVELEKAAKTITEENLEETIQKIVNISSNGDELITNIITHAYKELRYPSIHTEKSDTSDTYCEITMGYPSKVRIFDKIYINNENHTAEHKNVDVLVFDHRIKRDTYEKILRNLSAYCKRLGRHLICVAPSYDDDAIQTVIRRDLNEEYKNTGDINLILCSYPASTDFDKKAIADFAMLLGTSLIDKALENEIIEKLTEIGDIRKLINISDRGIEGINVFYGDGFNCIPYTNATRNINENNQYLLEAGFSQKVKISMKDSVFEMTKYDKKLYNKYLSDAKVELDEVVRKFEILGTYTRDVYEAQTRYTSLLMKTATIYVGGDSELSRDLLQDSVDDAVKAAESAFQYGYVLGCNVTLLGIIKNMIPTSEVTDTDTTDSIYTKTIENAVLNILYEGFQDVYRRVLVNAFGENDKNINTIIDESIAKQMVYDLSVRDYNKDVINSTKTDIEILTATLDLLKLLLTGNQVLLVNYQHDAE